MVAAVVVNGSNAGNAVLTRRRAISLSAATAAAVAFGSRFADAQIVQDLVYRIVLPQKIALPDFLAVSPAESEIAREIPRIISGNLKCSRGFVLLNPVSFEEISKTDMPPRFVDWRAVGAEVLLTGLVAEHADGRLKAEFRLWDVLRGAQLNGQQYFTPPDNFHRLAHIISDEVYERLTGKKGCFDRPFAEQLGTCCHE